MTAFLLAAAAMLAIASAFVLPTLLRTEKGMRFRWPGLAVALALPLAAIFLYAMLGTPKALLQSMPSALPDGAPQIGSAQIEAMVNRLAERLKNNPADADGWRMLARSYETLQRFDSASEAYQRLLALEPDNPNVLTDYAVALGMSLNRNLSGEPERLIERALAIDPNHVQALALAGSAAYERGEYAKAIVPWKKILAMVPPQTDIARSISASVAKAEKLAVSSTSAQPLRDK